MEQTKISLTESGYAFLKKRERDRVTVKAGYVSGVSSDASVFNQYAKLYKAVDTQYHPQMNCDECTMKMVTRVWSWYELAIAEYEASLVDPKPVSVGAPEVTEPIVPVTAPTNENSEKSEVVNEPRQANKVAKKATAKKTGKA